MGPKRHGEDGIGIGIDRGAQQVSKKMTEVEPNDGPTSVLDLGAFVGELTVEDDAASDDVALEGLEQELQDCKTDDVVAMILSKGTKLRDYTKDVENNLRQIELDSIEDYIKESDNLVSLHDQIHDCDTILTQMEKLLSGFQAEIGSISSDIKVLQEKSMDMGLKLKNRKAAESKLAKFVEDIIIPPRMIDIIVDGEVNEEYMSTLEILSKKLKYVETDTMVKTSKALNDVQPELEKLRQKAVSKVFDFIVQKLNALRKPKTNVQILQQSVLLKYKYVILFLKEHGKEVYLEVRAAYIDTMNKVLSTKIRAYIQALEKLQLDIATSSDLIGIDTRSTSLFLRGREPLKNRSSVFALGERINILKEIDESALIPHIAEANSKKYPYEVLFRSLHKLLMDTAASEYLFCDEFFGEQSMFYDIFAGPFSVVDEHLNTILPNCFDAIGLMLMIRIIYQHQLIMSRRRIPCLDSYLDKVNISLWPRFKMVFDMHLNSLRNANVRTLWEDDVHPHYVMRRYAEFTASLIQLNVDYGDGQLELNMERLRMAIDDLLVKLAKLFQKPKLQTVFLINNYDMTIAVLKEELLAEHFSDLIKFVKTRASENPSSSSERPITVTEVEPIVKDFASRWKAAIELMHNDVITSFSNFLCGMEILRAALTQLLLYYTRLSDCMKRIAGGSALNKDLVSISSIMKPSLVDELWLLDQSVIKQLLIAQVTELVWNSRGSFSVNLIWLGRSCSCLTDYPSTHGFEQVCVENLPRDQLLMQKFKLGWGRRLTFYEENTVAYQFSVHQKDIARLSSDIRVWCSFHIGSGKPSTLFEGKKAELLEANLCINRLVDRDSGSRWIWKKVLVQNPE
ncbi:UNVERIFIED_CONTAM: Vacuolar protein sorting-associated protein 52 A [Sesamum angustifolium]|uniref:Vacuolar protein sorting-associated protein 52 A n=1 Tax=Sesamum angustifolium TaxID=2727405 RepID=A0AAW2PW89_9LAMI